MKEWMLKELLEQTKKMVDLLLKENPDLNNLSNLANRMLMNMDRNQEIRLEIEQKCAEISALVKEYSQNCYPMNPEIVGCYTAIASLYSHLSKEFPEDVVAMALARFVEDYVKDRWGERTV